MTQKIRAINPQIIVTGEVDKPYYQIQYYDTADNKWHIGYGSYFYSYVREWLEECFDIVKSDIIPIRYGEWIWNKDHWECSVCGGNRFHDLSLSLDASYCGRCGAKMDIMSC